MSMLNVFLVGLGGFFGAITRFSLSQYINKKFSFKIPIATLFINLLGSFLLGLIIGIGMRGSALLLIGTGFMGAFTTFSTFKLEGIQLHLEKRKKDFFIYNGVSYGGGILLAYIGLELGHIFL
ncbi:fluoride efflux transporter CrcB [Bacillus sp. JJ1609]|uniref:fluoride efflux transporter CrcB n=1 Tax=Bacillus sp. JJ1609 TaxID=3122977 RepID=UPI002FFFA095